MTTLSREEMYDRVCESAASKGARYFTLVLGHEGKTYVCGYVGLGESEALEMSDAQGATVRAMIAGKGTPRRHQPRCFGAG